MNQAITFLIDGGDTVRDLTEGINPVAEYIFNWFIITIRLTVLDQMAKGVSFRHHGEEFEKDLVRLRWFHWQGYVYKALQMMEDLAWDIDAKASNEANKLARSLYGFDHSLRTNFSTIPNYGNRYRNEKAISSSIAESMVNHIVSKRFVKKSADALDQKLCSSAVTNTDVRAQ